MKCASALVWARAAHTKASLNNSFLHSKPRLLVNFSTQSPHEMDSTYRYTAMQPYIHRYTFHLFSFSCTVCLVLQNTLNIYLDFFFSGADFFAAMVIIFIMDARNNINIGRALKSCDECFFAQSSMNNKLCFEKFIEIYSLKIPTYLLFSSIKFHFVRIALGYLFMPKCLAGLAL